LHRQRLCNILGALHKTRNVMKVDYIMNTPTYTLAQLARELDAETQGNPAHQIQRLKDLEWISASNPVQADALYVIGSAKALQRRPAGRDAQCVLTLPSLAGAFPQALIVPEAKLRIALARLLALFKPATVQPDPDGLLVSPKANITAGARIYPGAIVMPYAEIGPGACIMPGAVIEPYALVDENTVIHSNAVIGERCRVGKNCIIHAGTVLGADGFGFHDQGGLRYKLEQIGNVEIGDHVELGAGCTIDRAAIESTRIGDYTKLDNQVHVAHNCQIGRYVYIAAVTGIAGSTVLEDQVVIGGMCAISDHVRICRGSYISSMSGVLQDVKEPGVYFGIPVRPARDMHKILAALKYLPEIVRTRKKG
jgi:UDP-3-O-[3-hydroxymyristoyl] glucosamine N-acyltransferase